MDMFKIVLDNNREYQIVPIEPSLTSEDAFHIMRRIVFDWEQKKLASELATKMSPNAEIAERIRKRLSDRKADL